MYAKALTGCFSHRCVEGCDNSIRVCIFTVHDGERSKLPSYHSLKGFQHIGIFQLFKVKLEFCVFWLAGSFQAKVGCHQQVVVTSTVCSWKTTCSGIVYASSEVLPHEHVLNLVLVLSIWLMPGPSSGCFVMTKVFTNTRSLKVANSRSLSTLSFVSSQKDLQMPCQFS